MVEQLFKKQYKSLVSIAYYILNDEDAAKDIVQDLFIKIYQNPIDLENIEKVESYLAVSVKNLCLNYLKERQSQSEHVNTFKLEYEFLLSTNGDSSEDLKEELQKYMAALPAQCRLILSMSRFEGLTNDEISTYLDISKRTVETQISNALRFLRKKFTERKK